MNTQNLRDCYKKLIKMNKLFKMNVYSQNKTRKRENLIMNNSKIEINLKTRTLSIIKKLLKKIKKQAFSKTQI